ncbi:MAG: Alkaline phosphatase D [Verrucomicrobia subdivision 3 bacterium]|nr:Alkaline phosphatase D [Limisphaerales bacterium]MCS1416956.1 Alkaline phosphatase D [Limisphaerales bacterium]
MRFPNLLLLITASLLLLSPKAVAKPKLLQAGPMIGHVGPHQARIWIRLKHHAVVSSFLWQADRAFQPAKIEDLGSGFHVLHFQSLTPATATTVQLEVTRGNAPMETATTSFRTAPLPSQTGNVRVAFGSCSKLSQYKSGPIYRAIAEEQPDMVIFVGDNSYFIIADGSKKHFETTGPIGDWNTLEGMLHRHLMTRVNPDLQNMFRSVPCYAVWDDHDYGPNNADRTFGLKEEATLAFRQMWANPAYGTAETPGIFSSFRHGPAEIFLMDDRYHKYSPQEHDDVTPQNGSIWGEAQLNWLLAGLKASTAPVKLIANGTQVLSKSKSGEGHYQEAVGEIERLLEFIQDHQIGGIVFLTGDRHFSEAMQQHIPNGPLLIECTSSPLQQNQNVGPLDGQEHENRLWAMRGNNFGLVTIDIPETGQGNITFETRDEKNQNCVVEGITCKTNWPLPALTF